DMVLYRLEEAIRWGLRLHKLHAEIGRQSEQRLRIHQDGASVLSTGFDLRGLGGAKRSSSCDTGRGQGGFFEECSSFHGCILTVSQRSPSSIPRMQSF